MRKHCPVLDLACAKWNGAVPHTRKTDLNLESIIALEGKRLVVLQGGSLAREILYYFENRSRAKRLRTWYPPHDGEPESFIP